MSQQSTTEDSVFARRMDDGEIRAAVGSFHPGEIAVVLFSTSAGVTELMALGELHEAGDIELIPVIPKQARVGGGLGWRSRRARQRAFRITMGLTWQKFAEKFPDTTRFVNISVLHDEHPPAAVCE